MTAKKGRKETPDILGNLLSGRDTSKTANPSTSKLLIQYNSETEKQYTSGAVIQHDSEMVEQGTSEEKIKATYYLSSEGADAIEELWYKLRKLASKEHRNQISKSLIVDQVLQLALEQLEDQGENSHIATRILR